MYVSRQSFLTRPTVDIPAPEFGPEAKLKIRALSGEIRADVVRASEDPDPSANVALFPRILADALIDEHGRPLYQPADMEALAALDFQLQRRLVDAAIALSGMNKTPAAAAGDARKN